VKEQVLDIGLVLKSINGKIDGLTKQLDAATKENVELRKENVELCKENTILKERLAVYQTPKDSHNSSIPPSKDSLATQGKKAKSYLQHVR